MVALPCWSRACSSVQPDRNRTIDGVTPGATPPTCTVKLPADAPQPHRGERGRVLRSTQAATAAAALVEQFNASQHRVKVVLQPATSDNAVQQQLARSPKTANPIGLVVLDDIRAQAVADSGKVLPAATCIKAAGTNNAVFLPAAKSYYTVEGQQMAASANLTAPILYVNRTAFKAAGLDPADPPQTPRPGLPGRGQARRRPIPPASRWPCPSRRGGWSRG